MKQTISVYDFERAFRDHNRIDNFSYAGLRALFDWLEEMEDDTGFEIELDVVGLCCDFSEYDSALACLDECGYDFKPESDDEEDQEAEALDYLHDHTSVIVFDGGIIIQGF